MAISIMVQIRDDDTKKKMEKNANGQKPMCGLSDRNKTFYTFCTRVQNVLLCRTSWSLLCRDYTFVQLSGHLIKSEPFPNFWRRTVKHAGVVRQVFDRSVLCVLLGLFLQGFLCFFQQQSYYSPVWFYVYAGCIFTAVVFQTYVCMYCKEEGIHSYWPLISQLILRFKWSPCSNSGIDFTWKQKNDSHAEEHRFQLFFVCFVVMFPDFIFCPFKTWLYIVPLCSHFTLWHRENASNVFRNASVTIDGTLVTQQDTCWYSNI